MAYDSILVGTQRFTQQGYIGSTNPGYAVTLFHVTAVGSSGNGQVVISSVNPSTTTATDVTTPYITLPLTTSGTAMTGEWDSNCGRTFGQGAALLNTCVGFSYAVVEYQIVKK
jgi:hypothetical protein